MTPIDTLAAAITALANDSERATWERNALASIENGSGDQRAVYAEFLGVELLAVRTLRQALADVEASTESVLARVMPRSKMEFGDLRLERRGGRDRRDWRHEDVVAALAMRFSLDEATGEVDPTLVPLYADIVRNYLTVAQVTGYRTTVLRPLGIDPDEYATCKPGRRTVQVSGGEAA